MSAGDLRAAIILRSVIHALGLAGVALMLIRAQVDPDAWWHLRVAAGIVGSGHVPVTDTISWWAYGTPWISPSWLNELLLYAGNQIAGPAGQSLLYLPAYLAIVVLADRLVAATTPSLSAPWRLVAVALMSIALLPVMAPRAGTWDLLFSLFAIYGWLAFRRTGSTLWLWLMRDALSEFRPGGARPDSIGPPTRARSRRHSNQFIRRADIVSLAVTGNSSPGKTGKAVFRQSVPGRYQRGR